MNSYLNNLEKLCYCLKRLLTAQTLFIWTTALPVSNNIKGGFLLDEISFLRDVLRLDLMEANYYAHQIMTRNKFDVLDLNSAFWNKLNMRAVDGVHWDKFAHRIITNMIVEHVCKSWKVDIPPYCRSCVRTLVGIEQTPVFHQVLVDHDSKKYVDDRVFGTNISNRSTGPFRNQKHNHRIRHQPYNKSVRK